MPTILMALINEFNCGNLDKAQHSLRKHWLNKVKDRTARTQLRERIVTPAQRKKKQKDALR